MAKPQIEDGHSDIANELLEAIIKTHFSNAEHSIFWAIVRKTYGWHKKTDKISYSQFEEATGLNRRHVGPALKRLIYRNIIVCTNAGERITSEYGIQKDYEKWGLAPITVTKSDTDNSVNLAPIIVTEYINHLAPISVASDTVPGKTGTDNGNTSDTDNGTDKRKNTKQKKLTKERDNKISFEEYKEIMREKYSDLDFDNEFQKWNLYWYEGNKKCINPKLALHNWLDRAREYKKEHINGAHQGSIRAVNPGSKPAHCWDGR